MYKLYGIPNCDTVKKAKTFLEDRGVDYEFINFKKQSPTKKELTKWKKFLGELPVNKRGRTYRKLKEEFEAGSVADQADLLISNSSAIKRPILEKSDAVLEVGFNKEKWESLF